MAASTTPGSQASLRQANQRRVIRTVRAAGSMTQAEIARATGLSAATVSNIVRELSSSGVVAVRPTSSGGRRARAVSLSRAAGLVVGIDFGHSHVRVAVGDLAHEVIAEDTVFIDVDSSAADGLDEAERLVRGALRKVGAEPDDIIGIGLGVPGPIESSGAVGSVSILPGWAGVNPREELARRFGRPVYVDNDANLGALGEATWGAARGMTEAAYIKLATGVGAGILVGGRVYRGVSGTAGEIGHITLDETGRMCRCGNRGCLETYAGARYLIELLRPTYAEDEELTAGRVVEVALAGDVAFRRVIADAGRHVGLGVANVCNLLNPQMVVVGGELAGVGDVLLDPIREVVRRCTLPSAADRLSVVAGVLGDRAQVLGALALVIHEADVHA